MSAYRDDTPEQVARLRDEVTQLRSDVDALAGVVGRMQERAEERQRPRRSVWAALGVSATDVVTGLLVIGGLILPFVAMVMVYFATRTEKPEPCRDERLLRGDKCHPDADVRPIADEFVCVCRRPASAPTKSEDGGGL